MPNFCEYDNLNKAQATYITYVLNHTTTPRRRESSCAYLPLSSSYKTELCLGLCCALTCSLLNSTQPH